MGSPFSAWHWVLVLGVLGGGYAIMAVVRAMRLSVPEAGPAGIGGWLVIVVLGELCSLLGGMAGITGSLAGPTGSGAGAIDYAGLGSALVWVGLATAILIAAFRRSRTFKPLWKIQGALFIAGAVVSVGSYVLMRPDDPFDQPGIIAAVAGVVLVALGWWYVNVSRRVRNTFGQAAPSQAGRPMQRPGPAVNMVERLLRWFATGFVLAGFPTAPAIVAGPNAFVDAFVLCATVGLVFAGVAAAVIRLRRHPAA
ncbi:hypothetical protein SAMN02745126_03281 [Enhydrobacter aerosaccus]|uniref:Uncharacterized protein n=1 Tax=Enhydrobacter aerosaccus TaxID=225324 RepID=A0A1T4QKP3_9HYPH|nr:hypothetical protein [Enhydrobacter aerosaccus]SKA04207.1 hypothetical protein SAMN02745126_03281 [Enhydrobacter aerosaccus]